MKINFSNFWKKAILKKTQLIHFLKRGERLINWFYRRKIDWIKMLQVLLMKLCILNFQAFVGNVEQLIALFAYQSSLLLSLHTFLPELRDNRRCVTWHERRRFLLVSYLFVMLYAYTVHRDSF